MTEYTMLVFSILSTASIVAIKCNAWWLWLIGYYAATKIQNKTFKVIVDKKPEQKGTDNGQRDNK